MSKTLLWLEFKIIFKISNSIYNIFSLYLEILTRLDIFLLLFPHFLLCTNIKSAAKAELQIIWDYFGVKVSHLQRAQRNFLFKTFIIQSIISSFKDLPNHLNHFHACIFVRAAVLPLILKGSVPACFYFEVWTCLF